METRLVRNPRRKKSEMPAGVVPCTAFDVWFYAQKEIAKHSTQSAINFYRKQTLDEELHRQARNLGTNALV